MYRVLLRKEPRLLIFQDNIKITFHDGVLMTRIGSKVQMIAVGPRLNTARFYGPCSRKALHNSAFFQQGL